MCASKYGYTLHLVTGQQQKA